MTVWVVRAGSKGEYEKTFMSQGLVGIHYDLTQSAADFDSRESLREHMSARRSADQVWSFSHDIQVGDMIVLPLKRPRVVNVGRVSGDYQYRNDLEPSHVRSVDWEAQDIPRSDFDQDLLSSMGGLATVFRVKPTDAESRIDRISDKHLGRDVAADAGPASLDNGVPDNGDPEFKVDLEKQISGRIIERIRQSFSGVRLGRLVAEILRASGYRALETRQGPDVGIDVVAGQGDMGFGHPRLCVQVNSGQTAVDISDYKRLQGNIGPFGADHGLLVSLGDFTRAVRDENERSFFQIRLWGPNDLVERLLETYDRLPDDIQSDIPLRNRRILIETE